MSDLSKCGEACNCMKCRGADTDIDDIWANSEWVVDPFDTYEPHELPPDAAKSSCIALRASELNIEVVDQAKLDLLDPSDLNGIPVRVGDSIEFQPPLGIPGIVRFSELEDGALFYIAQPYAYGGFWEKLQKTLEDGGEHNAVYNEYAGVGISVPDDRLVIRVTK